MIEVVIRGYGSAHVVELPWHLAIMLEWSLFQWAEDPHIS